MVDILERADDREYADFAVRNRGMFFSSPGFLELLVEHLGCEFRCFAVRERGAIVGVLPMMFSAPGRFGPAANSLPFYGSNGGFMVDRTLPVAKRSAVCSELHGALLEECRRRRCVSATVITSPFDEADDGQMVYDVVRPDFVDERIGQVTFLPRGCDDVGGALMTSYHSKTRNLVRKAMKGGFEIRETTMDPEALAFLHRVHADNLARIGGISKPLSFFCAIPRHFSPGEYRIFTAFLGDEPVAALLLFYYNGTVEYFTPVIVHEYRERQPLSALIYHAMQHAVVSGYERWNWGGTWKTQDGVYHFKKRWNADDLSYRYYVKCFNREVVNADRAELLRDYPGFFVLPFSELHGG